MRIIAFDIATVTGVAEGYAGSAPTSLSYKLKDAEDPPERAFRKLAMKMRDLFMVTRYDLAVIEAPINMGAMIELDPTHPKGFRSKSNPSTNYLLTGLVGLAHGLCGVYGIPAKNANVQSVRKHFLGTARPPDPKRAVLARCHQLGWLPKDSREHDRADACALHCYASDVWCKPATRELLLMPEPSR